MAGFEKFIIFRILGMHQIKVKVVHAARLQLAFKEGTDILFLLKIKIGQLIRQDVAVSRVTAGQAFL